MHHGESLVLFEQKKWNYVGEGEGFVGYLDWCVEEYMSRLEMWGMAELLGYNDTVYWFGIKNGEVIDIKHR